MAKPSVPRRIAENELLKMIKTNQPISIYNLRKLVGYLSYAGIHQYVNELEAKGKIKTKMRIGENNRTERIITINEDEQEKNLREEMNE